MLKFANLKIYRKLLILMILAGSLLAVSSSGRTAAMPCCNDHCEVAYDSCTTFCNVHYQNNPGRMAQCLEQCDDDYNACLIAQEPCDHFCP